MKKKVVARILALLLLSASCIPASAFNEPGTVGKPVVLSAGAETVAYIDRHDNLWIWGRTQYGMMGVLLQPGQDPLDPSSRLEPELQPAHGLSNRLK